MQPGGSECTGVLYNADCRRMPELADGSIELVVTSPPYWQIKDYGSAGQIGFGQSLHDYLRDLQQVWAECFRVLHEGGRLCVNIGDQFARASLYGRYRVIPLHAEIICQCAETGFDFMGSIIWRKKTTMNTTGGAVVMGSYPYPPNGIIEIDFEYILILKKPGTPRKAPREIKTRAALSKEEWKSWFSGHWDVGGARKIGHEAPFPDEIPRRLIRMFSFPGDTVLDPFAGRGTTARVALAQGRNTVGYEIRADFLPPARGQADLFGEALTVVSVHGDRFARLVFDMLDEALADYRLGLITALRIGLGKHAVNTAFVTAPRATALRDIDITHSKTIDALIAAQRDQFNGIGHLELGKKRFTAKLADPIFDRATTFHAVIRYLNIVDSFMENIVANPKNVFTRVERTLELDLEYGHVDARRESVKAWLPRLPVHTIVVGGVRLK